VDKALIGIVVVAAGAISLAVATWIFSWYRGRKLLEEAREWPTTKAIVQSGALEGTRESGRVVLPTFAFSYQVSGHYYGGRFCLIRKRRYPGKTPVESLIRQMIGRKILLRYDPNRPEAWFIPDETIDGCKVGQKIGSHLMHSYFPKD
jgi:hypothetical protein